MKSTTRCDPDPRLKLLEVEDDEDLGDLKLELR